MKVKMPPISLYISNMIIDDWSNQIWELKLWNDKLAKYVKQLLIKRSRRNIKGK